MASSSEPAPAIVSSTRLDEQTILDLIGLRLYRTEHSVPVHGSFQPVTAGWIYPLLVAVRRPQFATNEIATTATVDVLTRLSMMPSSTSAAHTLVHWPPVPGADGFDPQHMLHAGYLAMEALEARPIAATREVLEAHLPFTVTVHPELDHSSYLAESQEAELTPVASLLMLAWLIAARNS